MLHLNYVLRLDYISCVLTVSSTILIGRRNWEGWAVAGVNSVLICVIGLRTDQLGFIPANIFCMAMSAIHLRAWRKPDASTPPSSNDLSERVSQKRIFQSIRKNHITQPPNRLSPCTEQTLLRDFTPQSTGSRRRATARRSTAGRSGTRLAARS